MRSTEEYLCPFGLLTWPFFRGRRQGRQPLYIKLVQYPILRQIHVLMIFLLTKRVFALVELPTGTLQYWWGILDHPGVQALVTRILRLSTAGLFIPFAAFYCQLLQSLLCSMERQLLRYRSIATESGWTAGGQSWDTNNVPGYCPVWAFLTMSPTLSN